MLLSKLASFIRELGHFPVGGEIRLKARTDKDFPSHNVFLRFAKKKELLEKTIAWCTDQGDFNDVIDICQQSLAQHGIKKLQVESSPADDEIFGTVYLFKVGNYYKIGRSNSSGRREYELAIQLPEKLTKIHEISTDDPIGIEKYWHNRFADKRKNGEWFELTPTDVKAFKRRKFM